MMDEEFEDLPYLNDDFSFDTSTPIPQKRRKKSNISAISVDAIQYIENDKLSKIPTESPCHKNNSYHHHQKANLSFTNNVNEQDEKCPKSKGLQINDLKTDSEISCNLETSLLNILSNWSNDDVSSIITKKLKQNIHSSPKLFTPSVKRTGLLFDVSEAQKAHDQLSQTSIGPFFGLPSRLASLLEIHKGIKELYDWQNECLKLPAIKQKKNLIYSLPTSGGKTLVAEILIMRELLCYLKDTILVLPYISLVQEKVRGLAAFAVDLDFIIEEYAGIKGMMPPRKRRKRHTLYICTIEKAHSLVNSMIEAKRMEEIGLIVVDELHMIGEKGGRGASLESMLAKVKFTSQRTQIVGMSATLSNMADLQLFLNAEIYEKDFRPVELREFVKIRDELYEVKNKNVEEWCQLSRKLDFNYSKEMMQFDPEMITGLVKEVIPQNSCLVFCPTKKHCENVAKTICTLLPDSSIEHMKSDRVRLLNELVEDGNGNICDVLKMSVPYGIAYHHSGLTMDERKLIEEAYLAGVLCCLTCTSTLAAGVNLPAKRVILRAPYIGKEFISHSRYKQMIGRAGRAGIDSSGESILVVNNSDLENVRSLLASDIDVCESNFISEPNRLPILILSLVGLGIATTMDHIYSFMEHTLAVIQNRKISSTPSSLFREHVDELCRNKLLNYSKEIPSDLCITDVGRAAFRGGIDITSVHKFMNRLNNGLQALSLQSHLHLLYIITPTEIAASVPFSEDIFSQCYESLSEEDRSAAALMGVTEHIAMLILSGRMPSKHRQMIHHFYLTLILYDLWKHNSVWSVSQKYQVHRGVVQNLLGSASALGSTLSYFCQELHQFWAFQELLPSFVKQVSYCVTMELLPLMELPAVKRGRARQLYIAGFKTLADIARANPNELVQKVNHLPYKNANQIISAAKMILIEKAESLQEEAEMMIEAFNNNFSLLNETSVLPCQM